jgi:hypothetical protein
MPALDEDLACSRPQNAPRGLDHSTPMETDTVIVGMVSTLFSIITMLRLYFQAMGRRP